MAADKRKSSDEEDKRWQEEQDKRSREIDAQIRELGKQIRGEWGMIVDELEEDDLTAIIRTHLNGQAHYLSTRVRATDRTWEIDVLATNGDIAVPAEVKTTLTKDDIDKFVSHILNRFTTLLPEHGVVA